MEMKIKIDALVILYEYISCAIAISKNEGYKSEPSTLIFVIHIRYPFVHAQVKANVLI